MKTTRYDEAKYETAEPYDFTWAVKHDATYNDFDHSEKSDGKVTNGVYRVQLPDGRTQIVTYRADNYGYNADVKYTGEAKYPDKPTYSAPVYTAPAYKAPVYVATPVYKTPMVQPEY
uniref:Cuticle protein n=1 Tax=Daphnia galeata TaxID=27404 RepID=A0A8J2RD50_9CRUS|nr:unnamed protein product [Daphnia galeata]